MIFSFTTNVFAADLPIISNIESMEYYEEDGTYIEKITFVENGEDAAVIKRTYTNGSFDVEAVNGEIPVEQTKYAIKLRKFLNHQVLCNEG